jgi:hypothetical protein
MNIVDVPIVHVLMSISFVNRMSMRQVIFVDFIRSNDSDVDCLSNKSFACSLFRLSTRKRDIERKLQSDDKMLNVFIH